MSTQGNKSPSINPDNNLNNGLTVGPRDNVRPSAEPVSAPSFEERYEIVHPISHGGMGEIYLARDQKLGRPVALKRLLIQEDTDQKTVSRLLTEARSLALLQHPNIVTVWDVNEDPANPYISMEYIDGEDLKALIKREGALPITKALEIFKQVCSGLQVAHERGIIHRDIKPSNILLTADGTAKLTDFGLALQQRELNLTQTGASMGTVGYMAPEQLSDAKHVDRRADIYGLGATLYEMLTGESPRVIRLDIVPSNFRKALGKALQSDPEKRFPTARAFAEAVEITVTDGTVETFEKAESEAEISITSIDDVLSFRKAIKPIADVDFFIEPRRTDQKYNAEMIAAIIKGLNYYKEKKEYEDFKTRASRDLQVYQQQCQDTKSKLDSLKVDVGKKHPGSPPQRNLIGTANSTEDMLFQQHFESYRIAQRNYEMLQNELNETREQYNKAALSYNQKQREFEDYLHQKETHLKAALDLDILNFLTEMMRRADRSINYDKNFYEGFVLVFLTKKAYSFVYDYISTADARYKATHIYDKLEDDFNPIIFSHKNNVRVGLECAARCYIEETNKVHSKFNAISSLLEEIPNEECAKYQKQANDLISLPVNTLFALYPEKITDPDHLVELRNNIQQKKAEFQVNVKTISNLISEMKHMVDRIAETKESCTIRLKNMIVIDNVNKEKVRDLLFILSIFKGDEYDTVFMKYGRWLCAVEQEISQKLNIDLKGLLESLCDNKESPINKARCLIEDQNRWDLLKYPTKLNEKMKVFDVAIQSLESKAKYAYDREAELREAIKMQAFMACLETIAKETGGKPHEAGFSELLAAGKSIGWSAEKVKREYEKKSFGFHLARISEQNKRRLTETEYKELIKRGLEAGWSKIEIDSVIKPYIPWSSTSRLIVGLITIICVLLFSMLSLILSSNHKPENGDNHVTIPPDKYIPPPLAFRPSAEGLIRSYFEDLKNGNVDKAISKWDSPNEDSLKRFIDNISSIELREIWTEDTNQEKAKIHVDFVAEIKKPTKREQWVGPVNLIWKGDQWKIQSTKDLQRQNN